MEDSDFMPAVHKAADHMRADEPACADQKHPHEDARKSIPSHRQSVK